MFFFREKNKIVSALFFIQLLWRGANNYGDSTPLDHIKKYLKLFLFSLARNALARADIREWNQIKMRQKRMNKKKNLNNSVNNKLPSMKRTQKKKKLNYRQNNVKIFHFLFSSFYFNFFASLPSYESVDWCDLFWGNVELNEILSKICFQASL